MVSPAPSVAPAPPEPYRLSVEQYHAMRDAGILGEDDPVELLDGMLVAKMTKKPPHHLATGLVREALERVAPADCYVDSQEPITTADSEPEPDVVIVRGARREFSSRHPGPSDVALVVEIADDSIDRDRGSKAVVYARAGIACYWIVNLRARVVEVYGRPSGGAYSSRADFGPGSEIRFQIDGIEVARLRVDDLLP